MANPRRDQATGSPTDSSLTPAERDQATAWDRQWRSGQKAAEPVSAGFYAATTTPGRDPYERSATMAAGDYEGGHSAEAIEVAKRVGLEHRGDRQHGNQEPYVYGPGEHTTGDDSWWERSNHASHPFE